MNKHFKVFILSLLLAILAFITTYFETSLNGLSRIIYMVLLPIWFFSIMPSYIITFKWPNTKTFEESIEIGMFLKSLMFIGPILIAPILMVRYYLNYLLCKIK